MAIVEILIKAKDLTAGAFATTKAKLAAMHTSVGKAKAGWMGLGTKIKTTMANAIMPIMLVVAAVYAINSAVSSVTGQFADFESAMKGVQKTTGMTDEEVVAIGEDFKELSKTVPKSADELAGIGQIAGQLGIEGAEDITSFTETVAEASVAFDMDAKDAALGLAALVKIYGKTIPEATNLGSAVNEMGNTTGATEAQILTFGTSLGPTAEMLGFTAGEALGMGATLIELKMDASDAGTRLNSAFTMMGQKLPQVAEFLGITEQAFKDAFGEDPLGMLVEIIDKIHEIEDPLDQNTKLTQLFGRIGAKAMKGLAKDTGRLTENVENATDAYEEGTAMHAEYLIFASSYQSQLELIKNKANLAAIAVGEVLAPAILALGTALVDTVIPGFATLSEEIGKQTSETWPNFKEAVMDAFGKIVGDTNLVTWENIMTGLGVVIGTILSAILVGLTLLIEANGPFLTAIGGIVTCISEFISDIQNLSVSEAFSNLKTNIFTALGNIKDEIGGKVSPIVDKIKSVLGTTKDKVKTIFGDVKDAIFAKLNAIKESVGEKVAPVVEAIRVAFALAKDKVATVFGDVKEAIFTKLGEIKENVGEKVAPVVEAIRVAFAPTKDKIATVFSDVKGAIYAKLTTIKENVGEKVAPIVEAIRAKFAELPDKVAAIFVLVGTKISEFGEKLPGFIGEDIEVIGQAFADIGLALSSEEMKGHLEGFKSDVTTNVTDPLSVDVPAAVDTMESAVEGGALDTKAHMGIIDTAIALAKSKWKELPTVIDEVADATEDLEEDVEADMDKITIDVDGTKVTFEGLKGEVGDVVTEFGNFEGIAGDLIGLDWSVFTTLKEELPKIDKGIGDMQVAFEGLLGVLEDNVENFESIQEDLGDIDEAITPFVDAISPGITAVGSFGKALSDTQGVLSTFASMSEIDLEGMLGFEGAVHSMVMGLEILEGQIERLMPSFSDIVDTTKAIVKTFIEGSEVSVNFEQTFRDIMTSGKRTGLVMEDLKDAFMDLGDSEFIATYRMQQWIEKYNKDFLPAAGSGEEAVDNFTESQTFLSYQMDQSTKELRTHTGELTKISDAIQPLLGFMNQLNELYESVFGDKAAVWEMAKVQEVFATIEETIRLFGEALNEVDFGKFIGEAVDNSAGFMTAMRDQGSELNILTNYIDILLGYYVDLAELMARLAEAEADMGEESFEMAAAFGAIDEYIQGLIAYLPDLTMGLSALNDIWSENTDTISESMTAFHKIIAVIKVIELAYKDFTESMIELSQAQEMGTALGVDLSKGFEMLINFVDGLVDVIPKLATELNTLNKVWNENNEVVSKGVIAFVAAMEPIRTVGDTMFDFSKVMAITGDDVGTEFDSITDYIAKLTDFTPQLALALSGLKTVWDENSGAINDGVTAFSNIVGAISDVQTSIGDLVTAEGDLETAADEATLAVDEEADALAGHSLTTSLDEGTAASAILEGATDTLRDAIRSVVPAVTAAAGVISGVFVSAINNAASAMASLSGSAYGWGSSLMSNFVDGIYSQMDAIAGAMAHAAGIVDSYMGVHSNTELGALSHLEDFGPNLIRTFAQGINAELPKLNRMLADVSLGGVSMGGGASGRGNIRNVYMTINQNISSKGDANYAVKEIERLMKKPQII